MEIAKPPITPLDPLQRAAAEAPEGPVLVLGGTGTGRTHTLLARVAALLERGEPATGIACLSWSRQGAEDLRRRVAQCPETSSSSTAMFIGTLHRCALYALRTSGARIIGIPAHFTVCDRRQAVDRFANLLGGNPGLEIRPGEAGRVLRWHWLNQSRPSYDPVRPEVSSWSEAIRLYADEKGRQAVVDVDDLIPRAVQAMERSPEFRDAWRTKITRHLLVDDFQEITEAQYRLLTLMTGVTRSITVAANPNVHAGLQLGSSPSLLERFRLDQPEVDDGADLLKQDPRGRRVHLLRLNHRATALLSEAAGRMVGHRAMTGLHQDHQRPIRIPGTPPTLLRVEGRPPDMYRHVLQAARQMVDEGAAWKDLACIYRGPETFERMRTMVQAENIPYSVMGSGRRELAGDVGGVIAMLTALVNPEDVDAFSAAAATDLRPGRNRLDAGVVRQVCRTAREKGITLVEAAEARIADHKEGSRPRRDLLHVTSAWYELTAMLEDPDSSLADLCHRAMALLRVAGQSPSDPVVERSMLELLVMARTCPVYENDTPRNRLSRFLDELHVNLDHDHIPLEKTDPLAGNRGMTFSTVAASAGLQWHTVFVLDASDGVMPGQARSGDREQRLFHVASTRASDRLVYCYAVRSGESQNAVPSRFLDTIGDDLLQVEIIPGADPM